MQVRSELGKIKMVLRYFLVRVGGATAYLGGASAYLGGATAYLGGVTAYLVGGKMNLRIRLTSAKVGVGVEVEAELGKNCQVTHFYEIFKLYQDFNTIFFIHKYENKTSYINHLCQRFILFWPLHILVKYLY